MKTILEIAKKCGANNIEQYNKYWLEKGSIVFDNEAQLTATIEAWNRQNSEPVGYIDEFDNFENKLKNWMIEEPNTVWKPVYLAPQQPPAKELI